MKNNTTNLILVIAMMALGVSLLALITANRKQLIIHNRISPPPAPEKSITSKALSYVKDKAIQYFVGWVL